jgi:hypothetical protein
VKIGEVSLEGGKPEAAADLSVTGVKIPAHSCSGADKSDDARTEVAASDPRLGDDGKSSAVSSSASSAGDTPTT